MSYRQQQENEEEQQQRAEIKLRLKHSWYAKIDGFSVEIVNWGENFEHWNYYVSFEYQNTPKKLWDILTATSTTKYGIDYYDSWLVDIDWHGGITYGEYIWDGLQEIRAVKAGCDYSHLWDEGCQYDLDDIVRDAENTIASARALFADKVEETKD